MPFKKSLPDLIDATARTVAATWKTTLVVGGVLFVPAAWMLGSAYTHLFEWTSQTMHRSARGDLAPGRLLWQLAGVYAENIIAALAFAVAGIAVRACVALHAARVAAGAPGDLRDIVVTVVRGSLLRLVGQSLLLAAISGLVMAAGTVPAVIAIAVAAAFEAPVVAVVLGTVLIAAPTGVVVWLSVRFALAPEAVVIDGARVDASLDESARLVRGAWWRVLGRLFVVGLVVGFASSLASAPIAAFTVLPAYVELFRTLGASPGDQLAGMVDAFESLAGLGRPLALMTWLGSLTASFVMPVFAALLYLDLKAGRLEEDAAAARAEAQPIQDAQPGPTA